MEETKTGALVCRQPDAENGMVYKELLFIKNIPHSVTDEELKSKISLNMLPVDLSACDEVFFRADIHATTNEVQEQFEHLHPAGEPVPEINFPHT
ncbi:MAG TPA: hypothetical protein VJY62_11940 [Bacteroidia bacterium]|nr:hypothetical protein [Bacteroidia bacterium]